MTSGLSIHIPQGILQGSTGSALNDTIFYKFLSIPYAKPPIGDLRFKEPLPGEHWETVRDATKECNICYSRCEITGTVHGSEDCLYLNVYTKYNQKETNSLKPVMVWFPGGAFLRGTISPKLYGPEFLMNEDIVLVQVQYRTGILGFLRLHDSSLGIHGNAGLKDQTMALKWVKQNIQYFGGDPTNVTIFGNSAGGTSVSYHLLSSLSRGLFHKAIVQSGAALKGWDECAHNPIEIAQLVDDKISTEKDTLHLFKGLSVEKLYELQSKYVEEREVHTMNKQFGPVVENKDSKYPFISKNPIDIVTSGDYNDVPLIIGYNNKEGLVFEYYKMSNPKRTMTVDDCIPHFFKLERESEDRKNIERKIKTFYFKTEGEYEEKLIDLLGDVAYVTPSYAVAVNHARMSKYPIYLYRASMDTSINYLKRQIRYFKPGMCHFDEVSYLFNNIHTSKELKPNTPEEEAIKRMIKLWTSFSKCGDPTPNEELGVKWTPFTNDKHNFLSIGMELQAGINPDRERIQFWTKLYREHEATNKFL